MNRDRLVLPNTARDWRALSVLVGSVLLVVITTGCGETTTVETSARPVQSVATPQDIQPSATPTACEAFSVTAYSLLEDPSGAIAFIGNDEIFEAQINEVGTATKVEQPGLQVPFLVYVPVRVTVTRVYKGSLASGQRVVVRDLGGTAPDCSTLTYSESYPDAAWAPGAHVVVFANKATSPSGETGFTPNWVFLLRHDEAVSARDPSKSMPIQEMRAAIKARWGSE